MKKINIYFINEDFTSLNMSLSSFYSSLVGLKSDYIIKIENKIINLRNVTYIEEYINSDSEDYND